MTTIARDSLLTLEAYAKLRKTARAEAIAHRKRRSVALGEHITLQFEDEQTIRRQIQEMLHIEKIFDEEGIQSEIDAYAPLVPDGSNWKATMLIEYEDVEERRVALERLVDVEHRIWVAVGGEEKVFAIADEDLDRSRDNKTSAVHFLRFQLTPEQVTALKRGARLSFGVDHPECHYTVEEAPADTRASLLGDLA